MKPSLTFPAATPRASPFAGDAITLTATGGNDDVVFTASGGNATGVVTEMLLQPLATRRRTPQPNAYRSEVFTPLTVASPSEDVAAPAGFYALDYRFVKTATGQATELFPLPLVQVS